MILVITHDEDIILIESSEKSGEQENEVKDIDDKLIQSYTIGKSIEISSYHNADHIGYQFQGKSTPSLEIHSPPPE